MKKKFYWGLMVVMAICLMGLAACDSSDNGGGGVTPSAGYSASDLEGTWVTTWVNPGNFAVTAYITFNSAGQITKFSVPNIPPNQVFMKGTLAVDSAGNLSGVSTLIQQPAPDATIDWREMSFRSATYIAGKWIVLSIGNTPRRVYMDKVK